MFCNLAGQQLIKGDEDCKLSAYRDQGGVWSIGYGHTGPEVTEGLTITQAQADRWFIQDLQNTCSALTRLLTVSVNDNQFSALSSWAYNVGIGNAADSTLIKLLNAGHYMLVPMQLARWNRVNGVVSDGLTKRRNDEIALWNTPDEA